MTGFDNRTLRTMQQSRESRSLREATTQEALNKQKAQQHELATRALSESFRGRMDTEKHQAYENTVTNILELAHSGHDSLGITREDLQSAAEIALENPGSSYLEHNIAAIYANFPDFVDAQQTFNTDEYIPEEEYRAAKTRLSEFNSTLKNFIDGDPRIQPHELQRYLQDCALTYGYDGKQLEEINHVIPSKLKGMRHELGMESILYRLEGIDIEDTTTEDDINGIDERIRRDDNTLIFMDTKATRATADQARAKRDKHYRKKHGTPLPSNILIIHTGLRPEDFNPKAPWRPTEAAISRNIPRLQRLIDSVPKQ